MKLSIFFILTLFIVSNSFAQLKTCKNALFVQIHYDCDLNEKISDDPYKKFIPLSSKFLNEVIGTDYPNDEIIYGCCYKKNSFGYSFIYQRVRESNRSIKIMLVVTDKSTNLIAEEKIGEKQNAGMYENKSEYFFKYINDTTIEVNSQIMDYTYNNLIENTYSHFSLSKNGIVKNNGIPDKD